MGKLITPATIILSFLICLHVSPVMTDEYDDCNEHKDKKIQIKKCSQLIKSNRLKGKKLENAIFRRGDANLTIQEYTKAIDDFTQAINLSPDSSHYYYNRGQAYRGNGLYDLAVRDYTKAIELDSELPFIYFKRGNAYLLNGSLDLATRDFSIVIEMDNSEYEAYFKRGLIYEMQGKYEQALGDYKKALAQNPSYYRAKSRIKSLGLVR